MSKMLSLKLQEAVFEETEKMSKKLNTSRNAYINDALKFYNTLNTQRALKKQLAYESKLLREDSLREIKEWDNTLLDGLPEDDYDYS